MNNGIDYELGRLYTEMGEEDKASDQFELILSGGKGIRTNPSKGKGSISLRVSDFRSPHSVWERCDRLKPESGAYISAR